MFYDINFHYVESEYKKNVCYTYVLGLIDETQPQHSSVKEITSLDLTYTPEVYHFDVRNVSKYYIGKSNDINQRLNAHLNRKANAFTTRYPMYKVLRIVEGNCEDDLTINFMIAYGVNNVRGGSYTRMELNMLDQYAIATAICTKCNICFSCGKSGHFASTCYVKTPLNVITADFSEYAILITDQNQVSISKEIKDQNQASILDQNQASILDQNQASILDQNQASIVLCSRCGRNSHISKNCYATTHLNGNMLDADHNTLEKSIIECLTSCVSACFKK